MVSELVGSVEAGTDEVVVHAEVEGALKKGLVVLFTGLPFPFVSKQF